MGKRRPEMVYSKTVQFQVYDGHCDEYTAQYDSSTGKVLIIYEPKQPNVVRDIKEAVMAPGKRPERCFRSPFPNIGRAVIFSGSPRRLKKEPTSIK
jgi:hypothetical protein